MLDDDVGLLVAYLNRTEDFEGLVECPAFTPESSVQCSDDFVLGLLQFLLGWLGWLLGFVGLGFSFCEKY